MLNILEDLCTGSGIILKDSAILVWSLGRRRPETQHLNGMTNPKALSGAFWGILFGMLFFIPDFGMAVAAAMGSLAGKYSDYGFDRSYINRIRDSISEGTSALFVMTSEAVLERITAEVKQRGTQFGIISTNLSDAEEQKLNEDFGT